jgi:hypothetical protein
MLHEQRTSAPDRTNTAHRVKLLRCSPGNWRAAFAARQVAGDFDRRKRVSFGESDSDLTVTVTRTDLRLYPIPRQPNGYPEPGFVYLTLETTPKFALDHIPNKLSSETHAGRFWRGCHQRDGV